MRSRTPSETLRRAHEHVRRRTTSFRGAWGVSPPAGRSVLLRPYIFPLLDGWAGWRRRTHSVSR